MRFTPGLGQHGLGGAFIKEMKPYFAGEYYIYLNNGEKLKLSRSYKEKIKIIIDESI